MVDGLYRRAMRNASKILFVVALILFLFGLANALRSIGRFEGENTLNPQWLELITSVVIAFSYSVMPFTAAVAIERADRWFARHDGAGPADEG
jgi:purine-cytosine permease-like protein